MRDVIILGSGPAGLTAGVYAARAHLKPLIVDGHEPGGQLTLTTMVENFPGFPEGINGPELVENIKKQAEKFGAEYRHGSVVEADLSRRPFRLKVEGEWLESKCVIIASGASARWLGLDSEKKLIGHGVSSCATCDGFFCRGKKIMVVGGGDSAMEEAIFLARFGSEVSVVHRREEFRASKIMLERAHNNPKIKWITGTVVEEVLGVEQGVVKGVRLRSVKDGHTWEQEVQGFFVAIGHIPNTAVFKGQIELDDEGYIVSKGGAKTSVQGVFHAGDVQDRAYRQAVTAAGAGCMAAMEAERPLQLAGAINAYCAMLAERAGFRALYLSGAGVANASFGLPDLGLTTLTDVCADLRRITGATRLPVSGLGRSSTTKAIPAAAAASMQSIMVAW